MTEEKKDQRLSPSEHDEIIRVKLTQIRMMRDRNYVNLDITQRTREHDFLTRLQKINIDDAANQRETAKLAASGRIAEADQQKTSLSSKNRQLMRQLKEDAKAFWSVRTDSFNQYYIEAQRDDKTNTPILDVTGALVPNMFGKKVYVYYSTYDSQMTNAALKYVLDKIGIVSEKTATDPSTSQHIFHVILVTRQKLSTGAEDGINKMLNTKFEQFFYQDLYYPKVDHIAVPKHRLLTPDEKKTLISELSSKTGDDSSKMRVFENMPVLLLTDPIAKWYGFTYGDVIEITRTNIHYQSPVNETLYYRRVGH
jgi:DNA-directed RNA polymerase subunit H (RpoH/RPB5)